MVVLHVLTILGAHALKMADLDECVFHWNTDLTKLPLDPNLWDLPVPHIVSHLLGIQLMQVTLLQREPK